MNSKWISAVPLW